MTVIANLDVNLNVPTGGIDRGVGRAQQQLGSLDRSIASVKQSAGGLSSPFEEFGRKILSLIPGADRLIGTIKGIASSASSIKVKPIEIGYKFDKLPPLPKYAPQSIPVRLKRDSTLAQAAASTAASVAESSVRARSTRVDSISNGLLPAKLAALGVAAAKADSSLRSVGVAAAKTDSSIKALRNDLINLNEGDRLSSLDKKLSGKSFDTESLAQKAFGKSPNLSDRPYSKSDFNSPLDNPAQRSNLIPTLAARSRDRTELKIQAAAKLLQARREKDQAAIEKWINELIKLRENESKTIEKLTRARKALIPKYIDDNVRQSQLELAARGPVDSSPNRYKRDQFNQAFDFKNQSLFGQTSSVADRSKLIRQQRIDSLSDRDRYLFNGGSRAGYAAKSFLSGSRSAIGAGLASAAPAAAFTALTASATVAAVATGKVVQNLSKLDEAADAANRLGLEFNAFRGLNFGFERLLGDPAAFQDAAAKLTKSAANAVGGDTDLKAAFKKLGIDASKEFSGEQLLDEKSFFKIADGFAKIQSRAEQVQLAIELFGKSGAQILPALTSGGAELQKQFDWYDKINHKSEEQVEAISKVNDLWEDIGIVTDAFFGSLAAELAPTLQEILQLTEDTLMEMTGEDGWAGAAKVAGQAIKENILDPLIDVLELTKTAIGYLSTARDLVGKANSVLTFNPYNAVLGTIADQFGTKASVEPKFDAKKLRRDTQKIAETADTIDPELTSKQKVAQINRTIYLQEIARQDQLQAQYQAINQQLATAQRFGIIGLADQRRAEEKLGMLEAQLKTSREIADAAQKGNGVEARQKALGESAGVQLSLESRREELRILQLTAGFGAEARAKEIERLKQRNDLIKAGANADQLAASDAILARQRAIEKTTAARDAADATRKRFEQQVPPSPAFAGQSQDKLREFNAGLKDLVEQVKLGGLDERSFMLAGQELSKRIFQQQQQEKISPALVEAGSEGAYRELLRAVKGREVDKQLALGQATVDLLQGILSQIRDRQPNVMQGV